MPRRALDEFVERVRSLHAKDELDAAAVEVFAGFEAAGVRALLFKGPVLVALLYTADEHRGYADIDLLVAPPDLDSGREVLSTLDWNDASAQVVAGVEDVSGILHSDTWSRGGERGPLLIDLHWRLPGWDASPERVWDELARRRASIELAGRRVPVPDRSGLALHTATHAVQHGPDDVKAIGDLERALARWTPDVWREAAKLAREVGATPALAAGLRLVPSGAAMADELDLPASAHVEWDILNRAQRPRGTFHLDALAQASGLRERVDILRRSLLPTSLWITRRYQWAARSRALLLPAYAAHLLNAPVLAARACRFRRRARRLG
jgi:hypothetical protein